MAIIKCPECTKNISTDVENCIHCGFSIKKYFDNKLIMIYSNEFKKYYGEEYPEIVKDFDEIPKRFKRVYESDKWGFGYFCELMDQELNPMFSYMLDIKNLKNISENIDEKIINYTTSFFRPVRRLKAPALYYVIKKNNLSKEAVKDYGVFMGKNRDHDPWIAKYSDLIRKVIADHFDELGLNIDIFTEEQFNHQERRKNAIFDITSTNAKLEYQNPENLYDTLDRIRKSVYEKYLDYIYNKLFETIKPTKDENFGALELSNYIKKNYNIKYEIEDIIGFINDSVSSSRKILFCYPDTPSDYIKTANGKSISYNSYYYGTPQEYASYVKNHRYVFEDDDEEIVTDVEAKFIDENFEEILIKCFDYFLKEDKSNEYYGSYDEICKARELNLANVEKNRKSEENYINLLKLQDRIEYHKKVMEMTKVHFTDDGIKCPNCGSSSVEKISGLNRAVSIGLFGLASSKIGKTMHCKSCDYKW